MSLEDQSFQEGVSDTITINVDSKKKSVPDSWVELTIVEKPNLGKYSAFINKQTQTDIANATHMYTHTHKSSMMYNQGCIDPLKAGRGHATLIGPSQTAKC